MGASFVIVIALASFCCVKSSMTDFYISPGPVGQGTCTVNNTMLSPCYTLQDFTRSDLPSSNYSSVTITLLPGTHTMPEQQILSISELIEVSILSWNEHEVLIECQPESRIVFINVLQLKISFLHFLSCSLQLVYDQLADAQKSALFNENVFENSRDLYAVSVADFERGFNNVTFSKCFFLLNYGAISVTYSSPPKKLIISDTVFEGNWREANSSSGVIHVVGTTLVLRRSHLQKNRGSTILQAKSSSVVITNSTCTKNLAGNVFSLHLSNTEMHSCNFTDNLAKGDGVVAVFATSTGYGPHFLRTIILEGLTFVRNHANGTGGSIHIESADTSLFDCVFENNSATKGGAIYFRSKDQLLGIYRSVFIGNEAERHGGGIYCDDNGVIYMHGNQYLASNSADNGKGGFSYLSNCRLTMMWNGNGSIIGNHATKGGVVYAASSDVILHDVTFMSNEARDQGGVLYLVDSKLHSGTVTFLRNSVSPFTGKGGAIYVEDNNCNDISYPTVCFLRPDNDNVSMTFANNTASEGTALYGGLLDRCVVIYRSHIFSGKDFFLKISQTDPLISAVASNPIRVCLCGKDHEINCSIRELTVSKMSGEVFEFTGNIVDESQTPKDSFIIAHYRETEAKLGEGEGRNSISDKECDRLSYHIFTSNTSATLLLQPEGYCDHSQFSIVTIQITVIPCYRGLEKYSDRCQCERRLKKFVADCDIGTNSVTRQGNVWLRYDAEFLKVHTHCPLDYCSFASKSISLVHPDEQCANHHSGVICGACQDNYSITLGGSKCSQCSSKSAPFWLILAFAVAGVALVAFLLVLNLTISHGTLIGLIFYANIISISGLTSLQICRIHPVLSIFIAWINLDFGVETCFFPGMNTYQKTWLQFVFPTYIFLLVLVIIVASHYSSRAMKVFGRNNVAILATLFLLSYTKTLKIIVSALSFTEVLYGSANNVTEQLVPYKVWRHDGNIEYLKGKHFPLFVVAVMLLVFLFLPYTLALTFGQCIRSTHVRNKCVFRCVHSTVFISIMDAYHAPYNQHHRYWTGFMLIARCVLFLGFTFSREGGNKLLSNMLATSLVLTAILTFKICITAVYKNVYISVLELCFLFNLAILSATLQYLGTTSDRDSRICDTVSASVSVSMLMFLGIVVYHAYLKMSRRRWLVTLKAASINKLAVRGSRGQSSHITHYIKEQLVTTTEVTLREELLASSEVH